jgi:hypothetical protein
MTVVDIQGPETVVERASMHGLEFNIVNNTSNLWIETFYVFQIINGSYVRGTQWIDQDSDSILEIGDYLRINKTYGVNGNIDMNGHSIQLRDTGAFKHHPGRIYTPLAEFLEMNVAKTSTGWNMTVTWVNETIPAGFMSGGNVSFRVEDNNGDYFGGRPGVDIDLVPKEYWRTSLGLINHNSRNLSNINHNYYYVQGPYNITWFDNDENYILNTNDSILIENHSDLFENGYKFRLLCNNYGYLHTMIEITLN